MWHLLAVFKDLSQINKADNSIQTVGHFNLILVLRFLIYNNLINKSLKRL